MILRTNILPLGVYDPRGNLKYLNTRGGGGSGVNARWRGGVLKCPPLRSRKPRRVRKRAFGGLWGWWWSTLCQSFCWPRSSSSRSNGVIKVKFGPTHLFNSPVGVPVLMASGKRMEHGEKERNPSSQDALVAGLEPSIPELCVCYCHNRVST